MLSFSDEKQVDIIDAFNTSSRYLDDILNINMFLITEGYHLEAKIAPKNGN